MATANPHTVCQQSASATVIAEKLKLQTGRVEWPTWQHMVREQLEALLVAHCLKGDLCHVSQNPSNRR